MKNSFKKYSVLLMAALFSSSAFSSVIINGTRVVYPAKQREVTVQLSNNGASPALIQAWIDEGCAETTPENSKAPFIVSPPISRVEPDSGQALRISLTTTALAQNKESLFWLNVLEIPPAPSGSAADTTPENFLQVAFRTRVKLFYRPAGLSGEANDAPEKLQWSYVANGVTVKNPTPFYVSFTEINAVTRQKKVALAPHGDMLAPGQEKTLTFSTSSSIADIEYTTINDFGGRVNRSKNQQR